MSQPSEIHTLAGAYALDALSEIERAGFARHVASCPSCAIEVAELTETASRLAAPAWETPPARLREAVLAEVGLTRQVRPGTTERASHGEVRRWRRWTAAAVAAGVIAIGGVAAVWTVEQRKVDDLRQQAATLQADQNRLNAILAAGDARIGSSTVGGRGTMTVAVSPRLGDGIVLMSDLPALRDDQTYQMWLIDPRTGATSVGVMDPGTRSGSATFSQIGSAETVGVTVEPVGGSTKPSSDPIATVRIV